MDWQFWIDVGGTFTDCLARSPDGSQRWIKVLSSGLTKSEIGRFLSPTRITCPRCVGDGAEFWVGARAQGVDLQGNRVGSASVVDFDDSSGEFQLDRELPADTVAVEWDLGLHAPVVAIRRLLKCGLNQSLPTCRIYLGTTRGTNALLTRQGARTALVTTAGFRDLLRIGDQTRPRLFELAIRKRDVLFETSIEIAERTLADGTVEQAPDEAEVRQQLVALKASGIESVAVCFMHGYRFPENEQRVGRIASELGFVDVRVSHEVAPLIKMVNRAETTVLDAYLNPVVARYLDEIQQQLQEGSRIQLMTSFGGLVGREHFSGKDSVLSGPAGGVVGAARTAAAAGFERAISFDMGGTSTDVARYDGDFNLDYETQKADVRIVSPMMAIETVAAGGGSICRFDGTRLVVGPQSATSDPGPACYGKGGPLTVTDVNLFLGRLLPNQFPFALDRQAVENRLVEIQQAMNSAGFPIELSELAGGFLKIANNNMASAIHCVSVAQGFDPQDYVLVAFGGAGPQHSCAVAEELGIGRVIDHPQASILSAVGIQLADRSASRVRSVLQRLEPATIQDCRPLIDEMIEAVSRDLADSTTPDRPVRYQISYDLRYQGTEDTEPIAETVDLRSAFEDVHRRRYGYVQQDRNIEVASVRVFGRITGSPLPSAERTPNESSLRAEMFHQMHVPDREGVQEQVSAAVFARESLQPGDRIAGPAIIYSGLTSTIVDPGWSAVPLTDGQLLISRTEDSRVRSTSESPGHTADPVTLEIFNNRFSTIASQMGLSLQRTSISVNVKERLDFSCAIFTGDGQLVVNAPHIPVHLGAMSHTVRAVIQDNPAVRDGDAWVTNDPYRGGSHLPDITVVTPVFVDDRNEPDFWVASRSHHAEIGGRAPGSMPADARQLSEEGVLIQNFKLVDAGHDRFAAFRDLITAPPYPSRSPDENIADVSAQLAANRTGQLALANLVAEAGREKVIAYMHHIQAAAETKTRQALSLLPDRQTTFEDQMDNGRVIRLALDKCGDQISLDFTGTDPVSPDNLNANPAIVAAAILYVMRCLIDEEIPLNEGVIKPVQITLPECFLSPTPAAEPGASPAIVGGNVETSQRVVDVLLGALGIAAASQGTMNNWLMGDDTFGYYETVGGGSGATPDAHGVDAVHTHMTNTRLTDPEILETRFPVVLREFSIRRNSRGAGRFHGGEGIHREVEFLQPVVLSLLTNRRQTQPFGLLGGHPGAAGKNILVRDGEKMVLPAQCEEHVRPGDRMILLTPGGGGCGPDLEA